MSRIARGGGSGGGGGTQRGGAGRGALDAHRDVICIDVGRERVVVELRESDARLLICSTEHWTLNSEGTLRPEVRTVGVRWN